MEKEEKNVIDQVVDTTVDNNDTPVVESTENEVIEQKEDENPEDNSTVDNNTETEPEDSDGVSVEEPVVDTPDVPGEIGLDAPLTSNPVVDTPVEDPTLATTDEVIPVSTDVPGESAITEPVGTEPIVSEPVVDPVIPEDPSVLAPAEPVNVPVETPVDDITGPGPEAICACGDPNCDGSCDVTEPCSSSVAIGNFFGTIQECVSIVWRFHLKTRIYRYHDALNKFYEKALDIVDDIIEQYQGICGICEEPFVNCIVGDGKTEGEYLTELKAFVENNKCVLGDHSEINSTIDEFLGIIDSTLYKITSFTESAVKSFDEFVYEDYPAIKEACKYDRYGNRSCDDPDDEDYDPEMENGECGAEEE